MLSRAAAEAFLAAYVEARRDPAAGAALLAMHAPDASLLVAGRPEPRAAVDAEGFAASHWLMVEAQGRKDPAFPLAGAYELASWEPEQGRGVAWLRHDDPARGASLWVAFGLVEGPADGASLAWSVLRPAPEALDFTRGRVLALTEFPALRGQAGRPNRDWLDVAYRRRHGTARPALQFLPGARFSCQGSGDCCRRVEVHVEREAQAFLDAMPWAEIAPELAGTKLEPVGDQLLLRRADETCRFLDPQDRCRLHSYLGTPVFSVCVAYPYRFTATPEGVAVSQSFYCGSVSEACGAPVESQADDIQDRLALGGALAVPEVLRLTPEREVAWPAFRDLEATLRATLTRADRPLAERLELASRVLEAALAGEAADPDALPEPTPADDALAQALLDVGLMLIAQLDPPRLVPALLPSGGFRWAGAPLADPRMAARWFEAIHFAKDLAYRFDLATAHSVTVLLHAALLALEQAHGGRLPEELRARLAFFTTHDVLAELLGLAFERMPGLRALLARPDAARALAARYVQAPRKEPTSC